MVPGLKIASCSCGDTKTVEMGSSRGRQSSRESGLVDLESQISLISDVLQDIYYDRNLLEQVFIFTTLMNVKV